MRLGFIAEVFEVIQTDGLGFNGSFKLYVKYWLVEKTELTKLCHTLVDVLATFIRLNIQRGYLVPSRHRVDDDSAYSLLFRKS